MDHRSIPRIAVIGCGNIGSRFDEGREGTYALSHCGAYDALNIPIASLVDPDNTRLLEAKKHWGVANTYSSISELFANEKLDVVSICTPSELRFEPIRMCVEHGVKLIFCEKPLAVSTEEAKTIKELLDKHTCEIKINYSRRWDPTINKIKQMVSAGELGKVQAIRGVYGKGILNNGGHMINLIQYLFDAELLPRYVSKVEDGRNEDPTYNVVLQESNEGFEVHLSGTDSRNYTLWELDILTNSMRILLTKGGIKITIQRIASSGDFKGYQELVDFHSSNGTYYESMIAYIDEGISSYKTSKQIGQTDMIDAIRTLDVVEKISKFAN